MRYCKNSCFRHNRPTQLFLATVLLVVLGGVYAIYGKMNITIKQHSTQAVQERSLEKEQVQQEQRDEASTRPVEVFPALSLFPDKYTQSEAHMSLPYIRNLIEKTYNLKPYQQLIDAILSNEKRYKDGYYVFYHGTDNVWRLAQDVYTQLYAYFNPTQLALKSSDFTFMRFDEDYTAPSVKDFLVAELKNNGLVNDHGEMGAILLSVNLALFGNVGTPSECTWEYFLKSRGHLHPDRRIYEKIMDRFGLTHKYIPELMSLVNLYKTKEETIIQIFIPKDKVDEIGYVSWIKGIPAHKETMDWVKRSVRNKTYDKTRPAIIALTEQFKNEQERNPIFKDLLDRIEKGDFSLNAFLHMYRNNPEKIQDINDDMARLIFTPQLLLNPKSGIKVFRFSTATPEQLKQYHQRLNELINKIIAEK